VTLKRTVKMYVETMVKGLLEIVSVGEGKEHVARVHWAGTLAAA
jgi:hypothetical protein